MNVRILPNPKIARTLYEKYYAENEKVDDNQWVSSHWQQQREKFNVSLDDFGNVRSFNAFGIGDITARNPLRKIFYYVTQMIYLFELPQRFSLVKLMRKAHRVCKAMSIHFSYDCFRQMCDLELIVKYMPAVMRVQPRLTIMMIGDGCGFLSALIKSIMPNSIVILVDIGKTLFFQVVNLQRVFPKLKHVLVTDIANNDPCIDFLYCPVDKLEKLDNRLSLDITINICSMGEMNAHTIERYFAFLRHNSKKENLFYCCNRELKVLPGGEVSEFRKYPWSNRDLVLVDGKPSWYKFFLNYPNSRKGLRLFGFRIPFVNYFDGEIFHRLVVLAVS